MSDAPAWGTALLRVTLGALFVMHGYFAFAVLTPAGAAGDVTRLGFPPTLAVPLAWYLVAAQLGGGALLVIGLWTRLAALLQVPIMASAVFLVHFPQGFFLRGIIVDAAKDQAVAGGYEYALLVLAATLAVALLGGGELSVDARRGRRRPTRVP
jgi:putative oxidoreductase